MHCFRANTWYRSENPRAVCVFLSLVLVPSLTNRRVDHVHPTRYLSHLPAGIFYRMPLGKIITQRNFFLWSKIIRKAWLAHHIFSALKRDQIEVCTLNVRGLKYDFSSILSLLIWLLNFTQNDFSATSDKNTNFNISRICGISIFLCSRTV